VAIVDLPEGEHQYKFFVDGQWTHDPTEVMETSTIIRGVTIPSSMHIAILNSQYDIIVILQDI